MNGISIRSRMSWRTFGAGLAVLALLATLPGPGLAQTNPLVGTWRLDVLRSTYIPGPAPRSGTLTFQRAGENLIATNEGVTSQGDATRFVFMHTYDGEPHPTTGSPDVLDASAYARVDGNTVIFTRMKAGKLIAVGTQVLSPNGRTLTFTTNGIDANGQALRTVTVYEKQ